MLPEDVNKVRDKSYSKGKEKGFWIKKKKTSKKRLDTKEDPNNNHRIEDQGQSWDFDPD